MQCHQKNLCQHVITPPDGSRYFKIEMRTHTFTATVSLTAALLSGRGIKNTTEKIKLKLNNFLL